MPFFNPHKFAMSHKIELCHNYLILMEFAVILHDAGNAMQCCNTQLAKYM